MTKEKKKYIAFSKQFKLVREALNLTQTEVADKADVSVNYYARVERGEENPTFNILQKIANALNIKSLNVH